MIIILLITFLSGGNFFVMLLMWPTQIYNVYGKSKQGMYDAVQLADLIKVTTQLELVFEHFPLDLAL